MRKDVFIYSQFHFRIEYVVRAASRNLNRPNGTDCDCFVRRVHDHRTIGFRLIDLNQLEWARLRIR